MIRGIGVRGAVAINAITMIGIGPLVTIPLVLASLHGSTALWAWVVGGIVALCDGLGYAELGSLYPRSGGTYGFLRDGFGGGRIARGFAFVFVWQTVLSVPLLLASGYIGFAQYAAYLVPQLSDPHAQSLVAAAVAVVTVLALYRRIGAVAATSVAFAGIALFALVAVIAAAATHFSLAQALSHDARVGLFPALAAGLGPALVITLYDYAGYGAICNLGDEVLDPKRTLPRSVVIAILLVGALYLALQVGVLGVVPWHELVPATPDGAAPPAAQYVAATVIERTLGKAAALVVTVLILITAFASTFGNLLASARIPYAAAVDGAFLKPFARLEKNGRFPSVSLVTIGALSIPACFFSLGDVISALTAGLVIAANLAQLAALVAVRARGIRAPYRMWLFPLPALVAAAGWAYIFCSSGAKAIGFGLVTIVVGVVVFLIVERRRFATSRPGPA
jgi:amino acid transporter